MLFRSKTSPHADMGTMFRPLTGAEMAFMQRSVEEVYTTFVSRVSMGRGMTTEEVNAIGEGRVWSGVDAKRIGLVDGFGGLKEALAVAAKSAELGTDWRIVEILEEQDELTQFVNTLLTAKAPKLVGESGLVARSLQSLSRIVEGGSGVQARVPYDITIY